MSGGRILIEDWIDILRIPDLHIIRKMDWINAGNS